MRLSDTNYELKFLLFIILLPLSIYAANPNITKNKIKKKKEEENIKASRSALLRKTSKYDSCWNLYQKSMFP